MARRHRITRHFTVEGRGPFPFDMLRYDVCYPATEADSHKIGAAGYDAPSEIDLYTAYERGTEQLTPGRWQSFGWRITKIDGSLI